MSTRFTVEAGEAGRADLVLQRRFPATTRKLLTAFFADKQVLVDGHVAKKGTRLRAGAVVELRSDPPTPDDLRAVADPAAPLDVLYEDDDLIAVNKRASTPSHPLARGETGTAANAIVARYPECAGLGDDPRESGLVHRLDAETTGVLVAARNRAAWEALRAAFTAGRVTKHYLALVEGAVDDGESWEPIGDLDAHTRWTVDRRLGELTLLRCAPVTGDTRYGSGAAPPAPLDGQFLHAERLELPHPTRGDRITFEAPLPADRVALLDRLS
jgi:23S rRNA pseudouridine1911/1915/1917 synthase